MDLKFPHHENEIAQSCAACDAPFANVWMHNGFVRVDDEKMSKSLGNFFTVRDVLPRLRPEVLRAFLRASAITAAPVNYTDENLRQADAALQRLYLALRDVEPGAAVRSAAKASRAFAAAMDDDFNTPEAIAALQSARARTERREGGRRPARAPRALAAELRQLGALLGLARAPERLPGWRRARRCWPARRRRTGRVDAGRDRAPDCRRASRRASARTGPNPTASATSSPRAASCSRTAPTGTTWRRK